MTSALWQRPTVTMANTSRPSRFPTFALGNTNERPQQNLGGFPNSRWQTSSIWANDALGSFGKREAVGSRGSPTDEPFANNSTAFSSQSTATETEVWGKRSAAWNNTDSSHSRNDSGNTSPNRTREGGAHEATNAPTYYPSSQAQIPGAAASSRAGHASGRAKPGPSPESAAEHFGYGQYADFDKEQDRNDKFSNQIESGQSVRSFQNRGSQDSPYLTAAAAAAAAAGDHTVPTSSHSDPDSHSFGGYHYGGQAPTSLHSHRTSVGGLSNSFAPSGASRPFLSDQLRIDEELRQKFAQELSLGTGPNVVTDRRPAKGADYAGPTAQPFQFNPVSQPWEDAKGHHPSAPFDLLHTAYAEIMASGANGARSVGPGSQGSSAGQRGFRPVGGSPRSHGGTPQPSVPAWARMAPPRDAGVYLDPERRLQGHPFIPAAAPFYGAPIYTPNYPQQYAPAGVYDPMAIAAESAALHPGFRHQLLSVPAYGVNLTPYMTGVPSGPLKSSRDRDATKTMVSPLLAEFKASGGKSNKFSELRDIYNHIVEFSGDQQGSRFIQLKLETANSDEKEQVFREILPNAVPLMKDVFGNYVVQKFFQHGSQVQKKMLAATMKGKMLDLSQETYACRVVQKALEHILVEQQVELVRELEPHAFHLMKSSSGNHVVQKIITVVPHEYIGPIMNTFRGRVLELAVDMYGCRVVQRALDSGTDKEKAVIMTEIRARASDLIEDQYGNYVAQHVIKFGQPDERARMVGVVLQKLVPFCKHKFASNVVESCIEFGTAEDKHNIWRGLTTPAGETGFKPLGEVMVDQFGNYVLQKLFKHLEGEDRRALAEDLRPLVESAKKSGSVSKQINAIEKLLKELDPAPCLSDAAAASTGPGSPVLAADAGSSAAPTPNLTMEPNSPSSSSPRTNASAVDEVIEETPKSRVVPVANEVPAGPEMRLGDS
ncbi:hypothetical protein VTK73DRAFT_8155 [Phialemonium thermophilum]|uniref:PUM-HD domain-containing protein n=1 Tax=Phialemonium thermophilum TaxID=223376 RepID=A0ABR3W9Z2_9PEZI